MNKSSWGILWSHGPSGVAVGEGIGVSVGSGVGLSVDVGAGVGVEGCSFEGWWVGWLIVIGVMGTAVTGAVSIVAGAEWES